MIKVYDEGGKEIVRPDIVQYLAQEDTNTRLWRLEKLEKSKIPIGEKTLSLTVTDKEREVVLSPPWKSYILTNDSIGTSLYFRINHMEGPLTLGSPVNGGEVKSESFDYPIIQRFFFVAASGTTASVRLSGVQGKWAV